MPTKKKKITKKRVVKKAIVKNKVGGRGKANEARWIRAVTFYIDGGCADGSQQACMLEAGFPAITARKSSAKLKKHPVYLKWVKGQTKKNLVEKDNLNEKLLRWANSNIIDYFDFGNFVAGKDKHDNTEYRLISIKDLTQLPREVTDCISEIQETSNGIRIKLVDKLAAVAKLAEINGFIAPKKMEHSGEGGQPISVQFIFGNENLQPVISGSINRIKKFKVG